MFTTFLVPSNAPNMALWAQTKSTSVGRVLLVNEDDRFWEDSGPPSRTPFEIFILCRYKRLLRKDQSWALIKTIQFLENATFCDQTFFGGAIDRREALQYVPADLGSFGIMLAKTLRDAERGMEKAASEMDWSRRLYSRVLDSFFGRKGRILSWARRSHLRRKGCRTIRSSTSFRLAFTQQSLFTEDSQKIMSNAGFAQWLRKSHQNNAGRS